MRRDGGGEEPPGASSEKRVEISDGLLQRRSALTLRRRGPLPPPPPPPPNPSSAGDLRSPAARARPLPFSGSGRGGTGEGWRGFCHSAGSGGVPVGVMDWWQKVVFPVKRVWIVVAARVKVGRKTGECPVALLHALFSPAESLRPAAEAVGLLPPVSQFPWSPSSTPPIDCIRPPCRRRKLLERGSDGAGITFSSRTSATAQCFRFSAAIDIRRNLLSLPSRHSRLSQSANCRDLNFLPRFRAPPVQI